MFLDIPKILGPLGVQGMHKKAIINKYIRGTNTIEQKHIYEIVTNIQGAHVRNNTCKVTC